MKKVEFKKASGPLSEYATKARKDPVVVFKRGNRSQQLYRSETRMKRP